LSAAHGSGSPALSPWRVLLIAEVLFAVGYVVYLARHYSRSTYGAGKAMIDDDGRLSKMHPARAGFAFADNGRRNFSPEGLRRFSV